MSLADAGGFPKAYTDSFGIHAVLSLRVAVCSSGVSLWS